MTKQLWEGTQAFAEAALRGGCDFYAGYPITPTSGLLEYMSWRAPELGRTFIQGENESSIIHMLFGAGATGMRAMTATSCAGMSLMQEGLSWIARADVPMVIYNAQRYGTGTGAGGAGTDPQTDYKRDTRAGGHGDYYNIVLAPGSIQEGVDMIYTSFERAIKYRMVVMIQTAGTLSQMYEAVEMPEFKPSYEKPSWVLAGKWDEWGFSPWYSMVGATAPAKEYAAAKQKRYAVIKDENQMWDSGYLEDADYVMIAYGIVGRIVKNAVKKLRAQGEKVGYIRLLSLWPYPVKAFEQINPKVKAITTLESNDFGQMVEDAALTIHKVIPERNVSVYCRADGTPTNQAVAADWYAKMKAGSLERRF